MGDKIVHTKVTINHYYLNPESGYYEQIGNFEIGDYVRTVDGVGIIQSITILKEKPIVYNLHMEEGPNNYIVDGVVVHNQKTATY